MIPVVLLLAVGGLLEGGQRGLSPAEELSNRAVELARREQYAEAVALYEQALRVNPKLHQIHFNLGVALVKSGQATRAAASFRAFLKVYPNELRARELLGLSLVEAGDLPGAVAELEAVYKAKPGDAGIIFSLAYAHARAGNSDRGKEILARIESFPAQSALIEGLLLQREERLDEAKAKLEESLRHDARQAPALAALGRIHIIQNNDADAMRNLEAALRIAPNDAESTYQLGVMLIRNNRQEEGTKLLQRAIALRPAYAEPHYHLARQAFQAKRYGEARTLLEKANRLKPDIEPIRLLLGRTYQALGLTAQAQVEFTAVRRIKEATLAEQRKRLEADMVLLEKLPEIK